jgi:anti-sigma-K factor RskA
MTYSREELFELAASYALGATTPEENTAIEAAMPGWPELAAEVASFREVTAELARIAPVPPSAGVRDKLMRASREIPAEAMPSKRGAQWPWMLAAASIIGVAVLSVATIRQRERAEALAAKLEHRETTLNTLLHAEKDLRVVHMKAADTVNGPGIQFFWNEKHRSGVAHAFRLTPVPADKSYQLWVIADGKPVSVKVFNSDPDGHAMVEGLSLPATSRGVTAAYLTVEPAGGSPQPTSAPILKGVFAETY